MALSAEVLHPSTSNRHINNLAKILPEELLGRKYLILLADNGPDWAMCDANIISFGRLWLELKLCRLTVVHYSPHHSRFNFIERRWGRYALAKHSYLHDTCFGTDTTMHALHAWIGFWSLHILCTRGSWREPNSGALVDFNQFCA